mgnify:CR=1 FL=1
MTYVYFYNHQIYHFSNMFLVPVSETSKDDLDIGYNTRNEAENALFEYMDIISKNTLRYPEEMLQEQREIADNICIRPYNPILHVC